MSESRDALWYGWPGRIYMANVPLFTVTPRQKKNPLYSSCWPFFSLPPAFKIMSHAHWFDLEVPTDIHLVDLGHPWAFDPMNLVWPSINLASLESSNLQSRTLQRRDIEWYLSYVCLKSLLCWGWTDRDILHITGTVRGTQYAVCVSQSNVREHWCIPFSNKYISSDLFQPFYISRPLRRPWWGNSDKVPTTALHLARVYMVGVHKNGDQCIWG